MRYRDLDPDQRKTLRAIVREGRRAGANRVLLEAAVQTVLVEANARHLDHGDRDSVGAFQQRPSQGWGPAGETRSRDARQFFEAAKRAYRPGMSPGDLAATVQRPAAQFRGRYAQRADEARALLGSTPAGGKQKVGAGFDDRGERRHEKGTRILDRGSRYDAVKGLFDGGGLLEFAMSIKEIKAGEEEEAARARMEREGRHPSTLRSRRPVDDQLRPAGRKTKGTFRITGPNPGRLNKPIVSFAEKVSAVYGKPITGSDGTGHSYRTVNGRVSQHSTGDATDIPARGRKLIALGQAALIAAGMPEGKARRQKGGLYNVNGHQIIFNTHQGGDHTGHLHISAT